jgi:hypothetical protein
MPPEDETSPVVWIAGIGAVILLALTPSSPQMASGGAACGRPSPRRGRCPSACSPLTPSASPTRRASSRHDRRAVGPAGRDDPHPGPASRTVLPAGCTVNLTVAAGVDTTPVPDIRNPPESDALNALAEAGLRVGARTDAFDVTIPLGSVISQSPSASSSRRRSTMPSRRARSPPRARPRRRHRHPRPHTTHTDAPRPHRHPRRRRPRPRHRPRHRPTRRPDRSRGTVDRRRPRRSGPPRGSTRLVGRRACRLGRTGVRRVGRGARGRRWTRRSPRRTRSGGPGRRRRPALARAAGIVGLSRTRRLPARPDLVTRSGALSIEAAVAQWAARSAKCRRSGRPCWIVGRPSTWPSRPGCPQCGHRHIGMAPMVAATRPAVERAGGPT